MIQSIARESGGGVSIRFGTTDIRYFTHAVPCRVWVVHQDDDKEPQRSTPLFGPRTGVTGSAARRMKLIRQCSKGWPSHGRKWVEVHPVLWKPGDPIGEQLAAPPEGT